MLPADGGDLIQLGRVAVQVDNDHGLGCAVQLERPVQGGRVHVPRLVLRVDEHGLRAAVGDGISRRGEGQALAEHRVAGLHPRKDHGQMQRRRTGGQGHRIPLAHVVAHGLFKLVDVLAQRRDPVFAERILNVFQLIALVRHVRAGQQKTLIHVLHLFSSALLRHNAFSVSDYRAVIDY